PARLLAVGVCEHETIRSRGARISAAGGRMARCAGMVLVLAAAAPALAQSIDDQERRDADCIDLFNDPRYADEDEASLSHNPATLRARMGAFVAAESNGPRTKPPSPAGSGTLDLDGMVSLVAGGGTRTGIWFGVAAT